ncbi:MAG TPA: trypsin-like peptidase domain-containing protein [Propionibacteriaceae bacterium]|nr:trypsin-like peptidase domain-containing protein [Propionibacteriaceae bacterium]
MSNQPWFPTQDQSNQPYQPPEQSTANPSAGHRPAPPTAWPLSAAPAFPYGPTAPRAELATATMPPVAQPRPSRRWAQRLMTGAAVVALSFGSGAGGAWYVTQQSPAATPAAAITRVVQGSTSAPDWAVTAAAVIPSTVSIEVSGRAGTAAGSGVIWDTAGHIVTNHHVVAALGTGTSTITVTLADGTTLAATIVATDPTHDLAVLAVTNPPATLVPIQLGDDTTLKVGDPVMAIGNPLGLSETVTTGIVSALDRPVPTGQNSRGAATTTTSAIQVSAPINPGNSGGALVDAQGSLIGINFSIASLSSTSGSIGLGFAIPISEVSQIVGGMLSAVR